jgi:protocatechuate 3,4-dioxygenase beta subunit
MAPGYGVGWVTLDPDHDQPTAEISLRPEQVIHRRLFDVQGRPVPDVRVSVRWIHSDLPLAEAGLHDSSVRRRRDGVFYSPRDAHDYPAWPRPMTTDAEGRFTLRGVGQNLHAALTVHHPRFAHQMIQVNTDDNAESKTVTAALAPPQIVNVRVTYADTGQPVPHAPLQVTADQGRVTLFDESETDADGRTRINSYPTERGYEIMAFPPEGQPYLVASGGAGWPKGALEQTVNIALPRGVPVQGKVIEEGSGKPVPGALVDFTARGGRIGQDSIMSVHTDSDGSFRLGAQPAPGHLFVRGPDDTYVFQAIGSRVVREGQPGGGRLYSHADAALDLKPGMGSQEVNLVLRRGATVEGRVVGPDGQPVREAWIFSRLILDPSREAARYWTELYHGKVSNGAFAIRGLALDAEVPVYFLEPERKLGAVVNLSIKSAAGGPITVRLEPCGAARAWLVDPDSKPVAKPVRNLIITMVVTPGPASNNRSNDKAASLLSADEGDLTYVDPINNERELAPDAGGRITLPVLIPGATYRFIDYTMVVRGQTGPEIPKEFTVKPGQKLVLGEIRIAKPPR